MSPIGTPALVRARRTQLGTQMHSQWLRDGDAVTLVPLRPSSWEISSTGMLASVESHTQFEAVCPT